MSPYTPFAYLTITPSHTLQWAINKPVPTSRKPQFIWRLEAMTLFQRLLELHASLGQHFSRLQGSTIWQGVLLQRLRLLANVNHVLLLVQMQNILSCLLIKVLCSSLMNIKITLRGSNIPLYLWPIYGNRSPNLWTCWAQHQTHPGNGFRMWSYQKGQLHLLNWTVSSQVLYFDWWSLKKWLDLCLTFGMFWGWELSGSSSAMCSKVTFLPGSCIISGQCPYTPCTSSTWVWSVLNHFKSCTQIDDHHTGCCFEYLPPCPPDFNPVEQAFSVIKSHLCHQGIGFYYAQALYYELYHACEIMTAEMCKSFFWHSDCFITR